jgi:enoyl-CoA hydratase
MTADSGSPATATSEDSPRRVTIERDGHLVLIGLDRVDKRNAADFAMLQQLALAYGELDRDPEARVGVVFAHGDHFTGGLDLTDIAPRVGATGLDTIPDGGIDPWGITGPRVRKPVVLAVQGACFTLGIELALASDIVIAARDTVFAQLEVARAILPFGGATLRFPATAGWGNAMRWMLTGDRFDVIEAARLGVVHEIVEPGEQLARAVELAHRISVQAPLAVQATLHNSRKAVMEGPAVAARDLQAQLVRLMQTDDARIGLEAFVRRETPRFVGH